MTKKAQASKVKMLRITQVKSAIGFSVKHKKTIRALGFHHLHETVIHPDTPSLRGMLSKVNHLVTIEEQVEQ
jgi:large subunit ribosomal protein L30